MSNSAQHYRKNTAARASDMPSIGRRRTRTDWAGIGLGDAFRFGNDYRVRLSALNLLSKAMKETQQAVAVYAGVSPQSAGMPRLKPQLSPCYTAYPARMAAYAAIGLTAFLEYRELASHRLLELYLKEYLEDPAAADGVEIDSAIYKELAKRVVRCVQTRLLLEDLARASELASVEAYRLFAGAHCSHAPFATVMDIINAIVFYGDVLPTQLAKQGHPMTHALVVEISAVCQPYLRRLSTTPSDQLLELGCDWTKSLCVCLVVALSTVHGNEANRDNTNHNQSTSLSGNDQSECGSIEPDHLGSKLAIPPLKAPIQPTLFESLDIGELLGQEIRQSMSELENDLFALRKHFGEETRAELQTRALERFSEAISEAAGRQAEWEDPRSDLIEVLLGTVAFERGPIEGNPTEGHQVTVRLNGNNSVTGEQFDCSVELSEDIVAYTDLLNTCQPTINAIRRILYPSVEQIPITQKILTSGTLDPARLALGEITSAICRRNRMTPQPERRGRALLVIACDGSGSLNTSQMKMLKILAGSWLVATAKSGIQVLAGLYHSGVVRSGISGPLVQWIAHPKQTPAISYKDAVRALVTLPNTGTGVQSDALSLGFIMDEARKLTNGTIYLIHITDCHWNRSFSTGKSGEEEVQALLQSWRSTSQSLHITTVALGVQGETGLESLVDKTMTLTEAELDDQSAVADKVGQYVASCIADRHRILK